LHPPTDPDADDAGGTPAIGACTPSSPAPPCVACGQSAAQVCINGEWTCPLATECASPGPTPDAGDWCAEWLSDPYCADLPVDCADEFYTPSCADGEPACFLHGTCPALEDAGPPAPGDFACGNLSCDSSNSYCMVIELDAGDPLYKCAKFVGPCGGPLASCACLTDTVDPTCTCLAEQNGPGLLVTCPGQ
jgi:hypothetical protein